METNRSAFGTIILAAGNSERMGMPKALLKLASGRYFFEALILNYQAAGINTIALVIQKSIKKTIEKQLQKLPENFYIVENNEPEKGRMHSLQLGLNCMKNKAVFVHNIDNPLVSNSLLIQMKAKLASGCWVKPLFRNKGGHPILLSTEVANELAHAEFIKECTLKDVLKKYDQIKIETDEPEILLNINTPDEYQYFIDTH